jgi:hypothetical protein
MAILQIQDALDNASGHSRRSARLVNATAVVEKQLQHKSMTTILKLL